MKEEILRLLAVSFVFFLFILFFQPFPIDLLEYQDRLLFVTGMGLICFILSALVLVIIPVFFYGGLARKHWAYGPNQYFYALHIAALITGIIFYIRFAGGMHLDLYMIFKILLVSLIPPGILSMLYKIKGLEKANLDLVQKNRLLKDKLHQSLLEEDEKELTLPGGRSASDIKVVFGHIVLIRSMDNYVELFQMAEGNLKKEVIRETLKKMEELLNNHPCFIRIHRSALVNTKYVVKMVRKQGAYFLILKGLEEDVPVARQYIRIVREAISENSERCH